MLRTVYKRFLPILLLSLLPPGIMAASASEDYAGMTPEEKGLAIVREADRRDTGWKDQQVDMTMVLRNRQGDESIRIMRARALEVTGDGDKSYTLFDTPKDVEGTAFLSHTHALEPDDQWLYLPSLKRVKRIASANKSGPFMGSEFAYEDMSSQEVAKYTYKWLRDETLDGKEVFVIERQPAYEYSGYTRQIAWIDKEIYQPRKVEFYDRKNSLLKTLTFHDYRKYRGKFYRGDRMEMINHQTGKSSTLTWKNYKLSRGLTDADFDQSVLKRGW
uniref:Outer membrane lipoprotein-sorting protein n=1 Tax=Candidatus Kentrum sp. DK TaxID=2126562 RepID=A0A450SRF6_9GAMM|nr:MAG: outer membrane lipoprotein-sorting protein [Candidatus Kentron sp. DK]VFJ56656.1 MAG: outer membrane lipoprotein-sorting protein [Candidatus Kentron sp. DK]